MSKTYTIDDVKNAFVDGGLYVGCISFSVQGEANRRYDEKKLRVRIRKIGGMQIAYRFNPANQLFECRDHGYVGGSWQASGHNTDTLTELKAEELELFADLKKNPYE